MGWNCMIAVVHDTRLADLATLGWVPTPETVAWDEATTGAFEGVAGWEQGDHLVLATGSLYLMDAIDSLGSVGALHLAMFQSVTDSYWWETAGPAGRRSWQWSVHEQRVDSGTPHPAEAGIERLDEDTLFDLLYAVGLVYDEQLENATFVVLDTGLDTGTEPGGTIPRRKRGRWFGRSG